MDDLARLWNDLLGRLHGPLTFRILLQPAMAIFFGIRDGTRDAREGRPPYLHTLLTEASERRWMVAEGWKSIGRIIVLAVAMDIAYQVIVFRTIHPFEIVIVTIVLAIFPYSLVRGQVNRLVRRRSVT